MKYRIAAMKDKDSEIRAESLDAKDRATALKTFLDWYGSDEELKVMWGLKIERVK